MLPENIRVNFEKKNMLKFISHLDLLRTMKAAILRSGIPVWYSMGFNPQPKMIFALPLSIGTESECEFMDIKIVEEMPLEEIKDRLKNALTENMLIKDVYIPESSFKEIGWAEYEINAQGNFDISLLDKEKLVVTKRTKKGESDVDIRPLIKGYSVKGSIIKVLLSADSENYLNPEYIAKILNLDDYTIMRKRVYMRDGVTIFR